MWTELQQKRQGNRRRKEKSVKQEEDTNQRGERRYECICFCLACVLQSVFGTLCVSVCHGNNKLSVLTIRIHAITTLLSLLTKYYSWIRVFCFCLMCNTRLIRYYCSGELPAFQTGSEWLYVSPDPYCSQILPVRLINGSVQICFEFFFTICSGLQ